MEGLAKVTNTERIGHAGGERLPCLASFLVLIWVVGAVTSWEVFAFPGIHSDLQRLQRQLIFVLSSSKGTSLE